MADNTGIEWTDATWNPVRARLWEIQNDGAGKERLGWHCEHVSEGCRNCYAERINRRLGTGEPFKPGVLRGRHGYHGGGIDRPELFLDEKTLTAPLRWRKPRMIFVCSMTDLFADFVPDDWIDRVFAVMALCPQHTFQVLTKRPERMKQYFTDDAAMRDALIEGQAQKLHHQRTGEDPSMWLAVHMPLPNVWLGVSVEDQRRADERVPLLLETPAAVRFISAEPLLGPVDLTHGSAEHMARQRRALMRGDNRAPSLDWVIVGGESGPGARPAHPDWVRSIRDQCVAAEVPLFFKQWGAWRPFTEDENWGTRWMLMHRCGTVDIPDYRVPHYDEGELAIAEVGKKAAGAVLDGREWREMPA